jgi:dedicator of cytokinesis protein 3
MCKQSLYLVCKIFRRGKLLLDSKKKERLHTEFRRPFGGAAVSISDVLTSDYDEEKEYSMPIMEVNQESEFGTIEDFITNGETGKYRPLGTNDMIDIRLKMHFGSPDKVLAEKPTCAFTQKLGFPEVILPGYVRNDFYVTLYKADFEKGSKSTAKNVEVVMSAVSSKGQIFSDCIYVGCGTEAVSEYRSYIFYHCNTPCWNETIRVSLPLEQFHQAHLRFTFNHCTRSEGFKKGSKERTFGFSFLKLLQGDSTVIKNTGYDLFVYKFDNNVNFRSVEKYLNSPSHQLERDKLGKSVGTGPTRSTKESLTIKTFLCSTKLTQNFCIVNLLRWRKKSDDEVLDSLEKLPIVPPEEVVKFIQDVFDALFNILSERDDDFSLPVFKALVMYLFYCIR